MQSTGMFVCSGKGQDRLGLRTLHGLRKALLRKWIWKFSTDMVCIWKRMIHAKYGVEGFGWETKEARGSYLVGPWNKILKEFFWISESWAFKIGDGT